MAVESASEWDRGTGEGGRLIIRTDLNERIKESGIREDAIDKDYVIGAGAPGHWLRPAPKDLVGLQGWTMTLRPPSSISDDHPFNVRLRNFRDSLGFSKADLAAELGVSPITLYRWETASTRPSPLAAEKLWAMGFGDVAMSDTNIMTVPRLKNRAAKDGANAAAAKLRDEGMIALGTPDKRVTVLPAPFVRNGPPDQATFHRKLLDLQIASTLPVSDLYRRLSMVEEVEGFGHTSQHLLEKPRSVALSWNSNYGSHGWHRYVGRFPSHVIRTLLNHFGADSSSVVCDPFAGSGTTAVECRLLGIPFVGIEICSLSAMMTRTKAAFPSDPKPLFALPRTSSLSTTLRGRHSSEGATSPRFLIEKSSNGKAIAFHTSQTWNAGFPERHFLGLP